MKKILSISTILVIFALAFASVAEAQFREDKTKQSEYSGPIIKKEDPSNGSNLGNLFNMQMSHSYSVNMGTMGGQVYNMNAYTNTMRFFFNDQLTGEVNLSLLHSPFGPSNPYSFREQNQFDVMFNAQIDYQINDRMNLQLEVNRYPAGYGPYGFGGYRNAPFESGPIFRQP